MEMRTEYVPNPRDFKSLAVSKPLSKSISVITAPCAAVSIRELLNSESHDVQTIQHHETA